MSVSKSLPTPPEFVSDEAYVGSLLAFIISHDLFQKLCGGVHILDFLTQTPDLYTTLLPQEWIDWFAEKDIQHVLNLLMREDLETFSHDESVTPSPGPKALSGGAKLDNGGKRTPPATLVRYVRTVRKHTLAREVHLSGRVSSPESSKDHGLARSVAVGMNPKKIHEVGNFVRYIDELTRDINLHLENEVSHIVDFGSGQNYLGRALASPPYCKNVVAIESKHLNIDGAKSMDINAKLVKKKTIMRNKKAFRMGTEGAAIVPIATNGISKSTDCGESQTTDAIKSKPGEERGSIQYIESSIQDGDLSKIIPQIQGHQEQRSAPSNPQLLVISLHSCGNLLHHGLRSLVMNPQVKAVAMVGCCYNLMTERLGPPTYKLPTLRNPNARLEQCSTAGDPHGFPMSERFANNQHERGNGIRLNITARMMAVQAPQNWTPDDSEAFFTRHFYRALLQRIFVDRGVIGTPTDDTEAVEPGSLRGWTGAGHPIILGSLRKSCYSSFTAYVRGATEKLRGDAVHGPKIRERMDNLTDEDILAYEERFRSKKKELSIVWSLMAFSAGVVESTIVVDRWLYLKEQDAVKECWVEPIFDYKKSPRNLVVVGIKK